MKRLANAKKLVCMPGHNYIYEASMNRSKDLIEAGDLGRIVSCYAMYNIHHPEEVASAIPASCPANLDAQLVHPPLPRRQTQAALRNEGDVCITSNTRRKTSRWCNWKWRTAPLAHLCASFAADDHAADPWTVMVKVIGTGGSTRYSYRDHVEIKPGLVHSQTYTAYAGSIMNEVRALPRQLRPPRRSPAVNNGGRHHCSEDDRSMREVDSRPERGDDLRNFAQRMVWLRNDISEDDDRHSFVDGVVSNEW